MPVLKSLVSVDTNVLIDEELGEPDVLDALAVIRSRKDRESREAAAGALSNLLLRGYTPINITPLAHGIASSTALKLRLEGVIPHEEENDALIVAEAAHLECAILLSSDEHLAGAHEAGALWKVLKDCHAESDSLVIARPRDIVRKFGWKR